MSNTVGTRIATSRLYGRQLFVAAPGHRAHGKNPTCTQPATSEQGLSGETGTTGRAPSGQPPDRIASTGAGRVALPTMRLVIARCSVDYAGRLTAHLPSAPRLILVKADGSVSIHADDRAYKPLNWMSPPCTLKEGPGDDEGTAGVWTVVNKAGEKLIITMEEVLHDSSYELGVDPGLIKDGVEAHLQELLADRIETLGEGYSLIRREYMTAIGPVDILCRDADGDTVAVEIKRRGEIDGSESKEGTASPKPRHWAVEIKRRATIDAVEQLTRYLEFLNRDTTIAPVGGILAAQSIAPQARTLAEDRGMRCVVLDYDELRGIDNKEDRLF